MKRRNFIKTAGAVALTAMITRRLDAAKLTETVAAAPMLKLNNGLEMPQLGLGTFNIPSHEIAKTACIDSFKCNYRHVDTAHVYNTERALGEAVKASGVPRKELWITSKLWPSEYGEGVTLEAIDKMLARLQTDFIDMLYVHQPVGDFVGAWKDMEKAVAAGKVRSLGISNFDDSDEAFHAIVDKMKIKPAALQIECHPYAQRLDIREKVKPYNIQIECWFPLGGAMSNGVLHKDADIKKIADAHGKTNAQIILRWHIQEGFSAIPGSTNPAHIKENISIFDFALSDAEMATMRSLNKEKRFFNMTLEQKQGFVNFKLQD
jgi:diketogulonate reductase-like aldo/keto reductase